MRYTSARFQRIQVATKECVSRIQTGLSPEWVIGLVMGLLLAVATAGCSPSEPPTDDQSAEAPNPSAAFVDDERIVRVEQDEPGAEIAYGRTYEEQRFSPLTEINRGTIKDLGLAWTKEIAIRHRLQSTPLVVDGVMYYTDSWSFRSHRSRTDPCGAVSRRRASVMLYER